MKRFYKNATVDRIDDENADGGGYGVLLDGRSIKTPGKNLLKLPGRALAEAVAAEWQEQGEEVDPATMPMMRFGATAIDRVTTQRHAIIDEISAFGGHDLLCYRGEEPELAVLQAKLWQPLLDWAADTLGARLAITEGISSVEQDPAVLERLKNLVSDCSDMQLSALHTMTSIAGSLIIALATVRGEINVDKAWEATTVDERFQEIQWGRDAEAEERLEARRQALADAYRFYAMCENP